MASIRKRGDAWYLDWRHGGQRHTISIGKISKREAEAALAAKEYELAHNRGLIPGGPSFRAFVLEYLTWHETEYPDSHERIRQLVNQHLMPVFGLFPIGMIERQRLEQYKRDRNAAVGTIAKELRTLQAIVNKAVEWNVIDRNPLKGIKPPRDTRDRPPPFYTLEEIKKIYGAALGTLNEARWRLMFNTGMRRTEALLLQKEWIDDRGIKILSTESGRTKSGKWRLIPHNTETKKALTTLSAVDGAHVLPHIHQKSFSRAFDNTLRRAELPGSLHWTRHSYTSHLVMNGAPLRTVQILLGHSSIKTTERYAHLAPDHMADVVSRIAL